MIPQRPNRQPVIQRNVVSAAEPRLRDPALLRFASEGMPWQRSLRWKPPPRDRRLLLLGLLIAIAFTVIELIGFGLGMRQQIAGVTPAPRPRTIDVVLIEPPPTLPMPPEPEPPPFTPRTTKVRVEAPKVELPPPPQAAEEDTEAMRARMGASGEGAPRLFNPDGSIRLGTPLTQPTHQPANPQEEAKKRWVEMEQRGENPLNCKRTRFARAFKRDQSLGDEVSSKYLKWIGLGDPEAIQHRAEQREQRAEEGCDPTR
ncbi:MAG TPA: hypothetical protein VGO25_09170 [Rhodanobacteraceae bacterium]|nr:hypothetical protein [Rhodanobacteraceae bacterium]